jgi:hypothetical protein
LLILVTAGVGWVARRRRFTVEGIGPLDEDTKTLFGRRNRRWHLAGSLLVPAVQAVVFGIGLRQLAAQVERPWLFWGAARGLLITLIIVVAAAVALIVLTEVVALVARLKYGWSARGYRQAWGWAAGLTHHSDGSAAADRHRARHRVGGRGDERGLGRAAPGDLQRGRLPDRRGLAAAEDWGGLPAGGHRRAGRADRAGVRVRPVVGQNRPGHRRHDAGPRRQRGPRAPGLSRRTTPAGHPGRAPWAELHRPGARHDLRGPPRQTAPAGARRAKNVLLWFQLTSPGLGEPGGLLQQKVAEIFSSDQPPFYKGFLRLDTTDSEMAITLHQVFGEIPAGTIAVATLPLTRDPGSAD